MDFLSDYRSLCLEFGIPSNKQSDFESSLESILYSATTETQSKELAEQFLAQAARFGVKKERLGEFAGRLEEITKKHPDEVREVLEKFGISSASLRGAWGTFVAAVGGPVVAATVAGVFAGAVIYSGVKNFYPGGWGGLGSDLNDLTLKLIR